MKRNGTRVALYGDAVCQGMTLEDANKVARAIGLADGGCGHCAQEIADELNESFPSFSFEEDPTSDGEMDRHPMRAVRR